MLVKRHVQLIAAARPMLTHVEHDGDVMASYRMIIRVSLLLETSFQIVSACLIGWFVLETVHDFIKIIVD